MADLERLEAGVNGGRSPRTLISSDTVLLGLREVMGSDRTAANESPDLGRAAAVSVSQSVFILGEKKQTINHRILRDVLSTLTLPIDVTAVGAGNIAAKVSFGFPECVNNMLIISVHLQRQSSCSILEL